MKWPHALCILMGLFAHSGRAQDFVVDELIMKFKDSYKVSLRTYKDQPQRSGLYIGNDLLIRLGGQVRRIAPVFDIPAKYTSKQSQRLRQAYVLSLEGEVTSKLFGELRDSGYFEGIFYKYPGLEREPEGTEVFNESRSSTVPAFSAPNYEDKQFYLNRAPYGVNAHYAWTKKGGDGQGVRVISMESWSNRNHIEFGDRFWSLILNGNGRNSYHGTAVWGIIAAKRDGMGISGIAHNAQFGVSELYDSCKSKLGCALDGYFAARGIVRAVKKLRKGDVLHIAFADILQNAQGKITDAPAENQPLVYEAIKWATEQGIHVVQGAGNSLTNLDAESFRGRYQRSTFDSHSIIVGASTSHLRGKRGRLWVDPKRPDTTGSNYGSRIDVYAPGEDLFTAGSGSPKQLEWLGPVYGQGNATYIANFGGTSGASAVIAGVVASISGMAKAHCVNLSPIEMRKVLSFGTRSKEGVKRPIGKMPDLKKIYRKIIRKRAKCSRRRK